MLRLRHLIVLLGEFVALAWVNRAIGPLLVAMMVLIAGLFAVVGQVAAPYIYTFF